MAYLEVCLFCKNLTIGKTTILVLWKKKCGFCKLLLKIFKKCMSFIHPFKIRLSIHEHEINTT